MLQHGCFKFCDAEAISEERSQRKVKGKDLSMNQHPPTMRLVPFFEIWCVESVCPGASSILD